MKPLIGITGYYVPNKEMEAHRVRGTLGQDMLMSPMDYSCSIEEAGGLPVVLPALDDPAGAAHYVQRLDGLLLAGGEDISPAYYGQEPLPSLGAVIPQRDRFEWAVLKAALEKGIPIFGICRGFQLLNVYFGGTLYQDLPTCFNDAVPHGSAHLGRENLAHDVTLKEGTFLSRCYGTDTLPVNSLHHQGVAMLANELVTTATSADGLVEGFQHSTLKNVFGVQWHPEMMRERYPVHKNLFREFVEKAKEFPQNI